MGIRELSFSERRDWLRLIRTQNLGPIAFRDLMRRYGDASKALDALPSMIRGRRIEIPDIREIESEMELSDQMGIKILAACESSYPNALREIDPPPPIISVWGNPDILSKPCIAIIGSRNASAIGQRFAGQIAQELGEAGLTVISGLARGIDTQAHWGALGTGTAAVLGGGVDHVYPRQNEDLFEEIKNKGALISESPIGYSATARDFPRRNRIISGLSMGVVVIEAAERSGTLITARYALEQGREVMAAPGSPLDPRTKGCNRLIRQGAALIENAQDVLDAISSTGQMREPVSPYDSSSDYREVDGDLDKAKLAIKALLSPTPTPRDDIIRLSRLPISLAIGALLEMELSGDIFVEPDGRVSGV